MKYTKIFDSVSEVGASMDVNVPFVGSVDGSNKIVIGKPLNSSETRKIYPTDDSTFLTFNKGITTFKYTANEDGGEFIVNEGNGKNKIYYSDYGRTYIFKRSEANDGTKDGIQYYAYLLINEEIKVYWYITHTEENTYNEDILESEGEDSTIEDAEFTSFPPQYTLVAPTEEELNNKEQICAILKGTHTVEYEGVITSFQPSLTLGDSDLNNNLVKLYYPNTVKNIQTLSLNYCSNLTTIFLPSELETIEYGNFIAISNIKKIIIPDSVKTIKNQCFVFTTLEEVVFGKSLESIGSGSFNDVIVNKITFRSTVPPTIQQDFLSRMGGVRIKNGKIYIPQEADLAAYTSALSMLVNETNNWTIEKIDMDL